MTFKSEEEFDRWKSEMEERTKSDFIKDTGSKSVGGEGDVKIKLLIFC